MRLGLWILSWLFVVNTYGQSDRCYSMISETIGQGQRALDQWWASSSSSGSPAWHNRSITYIPVVIHQVSPSWYQKISLAQALQQVDVLNEDFAGNGQNVKKLPDEFRSLVGDPGLRFCLATVDPSGAPSSGITYTETTIRDIAIRYDEFGRRVIMHSDAGGADAWDTKKYINIWVGEFNSILGSSSFPGVTMDESEMGVVISLFHLGSIGDSGNFNEYGGGHTLTHELGHFFGLLHIWGEGTDADCGDSDNIDDTPNAAGPHFGCPGTELFSCGSSDMYQNFMDLTNDFCLALFTKDQAARMSSVAQQFYPELGTTSSCVSEQPDFDSWYHELVWANDAVHGKIIVYHPMGFPEPVAVRVYDMSGKMIRDLTWQDGLTLYLDLSGVASGVYVVAMTNANHREARRVLIL